MAMEAEHVARFARTCDIESQVPDLPDGLLDLLRVAFRQDARFYVDAVFQTHAHATTEEHALRDRAVRLARTHARDRTLQDPVSSLLRECVGPSREARSGHSCRPASRSSASRHPNCTARAV